MHSTLKALCVCSLTITNPLATYVDVFDLFSLSFLSLTCWLTPACPVLLVLPLLLLWTLTHRSPPLATKDPGILGNNL